ncbi:MAG: Gfo/Idh/MocA family oxidoreductase [Myxococcota bacterium]|nr:Gfo/Idh/MocA family oxidoreductase [Myxococcota bacterium]
MTPETLRVGLIGAGSMAQHRHVPAWKRDGRARLVAIADVNLDRAQQLAGELGIARVYEKYEDMLEAGDLDVCDVCTLSASHASVATSCLQAGMHVIVEKPMAMTWESGRALHDAIQASSKKYTVVFNYRFTPLMVALKRLIADGGLGELVSLRGQFGWPSTDHHDQFKQEFPTGILFETGIHGIDLAVALLGDVHRAFAVPLWSEAGGATIVTSILEHAHGTTSSLNVSFRHPRSEHCLEVFGTRAVARLDFETHGLTVERGGRLDRVLPHWKRFATGVHSLVRGRGLSFGSQHPFDRIVSGFVDAIHDDGAPPVTPEQALYTLRVADRLRASIETGEVQTLEPR